MRATSPDDVERFDAAVASADADAALAIVEDLLSLGVDPVAVMVDVVAPVQQRVGQRWQSGEWSVAQEHAATSVAVSALESVGRATPEVTPTRGRVVLACAEREWHAVPAMIVAGALRGQGWETLLLGASTPTSRLSRYLQDLGPDVTAVSCSVAAGLPNARGFIEASTTAGIPVLAGGAAFGPDERRALALGATAWAADARGAAEAILGLPSVVGPVVPLDAAVTHEVSALRRAHPRLVEAALAHSGVTHDPLGGEDPLWEAFDHALHAVAAALLTGDEGLLPETAAWTSQVLRARHFTDPEATVRAGVLAALEGHPGATTLVAEHWPR